MASPLVDVLCFSLALLGVLLTIFGVPGQFAPALVAFGYWLLGGDARFPAWAPWTLLGLAVAAEGVEAAAGIWGARRYGAGRLGMLGALIGGILGAVIGGLALPPLGAVPGAFVGCFAFTFLAEFALVGRTEEEAVRAGIGAVLGKAIAVAFKYSVGFVSLGILAWRLWLS